MLLTGEAIKRDLKGCDIPLDLCLDRSALEAAIDVPEPLLGALVGFQL
jgi:hypothetical protein